MALTFDEAARISKTAHQPTEAETELTEREVTYRKFVRLFAVGALLLPLYFILLLWCSK